MPEPTPYSNLKAAIAVLEQKQAESRQALQEEFKITYEKLNPFYFIRNAIRSFSGSPEIKNNLIAIAIPLLTGYIGKRAFSGNRIPNVIKQTGIVLLDGLTRYIKQNPEVISSISHYLVNIFGKKKSSRSAADQA